MEQLCETLEQELSIPLDDPNGDAIMFDVTEMNGGGPWIQLYFRCLKEILQQQNDILDDIEDETVGFEVNCCGEKIHIFPNTELHVSEKLSQIFISIKINFNFFWFLSDDQWH